MLESPSNKSIEIQLNLLLASKAIGASPRMKRLLAHIVEKTLAAESLDLNGYAIGLDVFDKAEAFDPQTDSIVRVQAGRLRKLLESYYADEGANDPIIISLPKGTYVPIFKERQTSKPNHSGVYTRVAAAALLSLFALAVFNLRLPADSEANFQYALDTSNGPSVIVLPFDIVERRNAATSESGASAIASSGLQILITEKLSRFGNLQVIHAHNEASPEPHQAALELGVDYYLTGTIQIDNDHLMLTTVLADAPNRMVVWSRSFEEELSSASTIFEIETDIAEGISAALGASQSALRQDFAQRAAKLPSVDAMNYLCLFEFFEYVDRKTEIGHSEVRTCLEASTTQNPNFSSGWSALSMIYGDEARNGFNVRDDNARQRALIAAQTAVAADAKNAMAHQYLAAAYFALGDDSGFRQAANEALMLNPNDPDILADIGNQLIQLDSLDQGVKLVLKAIDLNPGHSSNYHGSLSMYFYRQGQPSEALYHAERFRRDETVLSQALFVATLVHDGQLSRATTEYLDLIAKHPEFEEQKLDLVRAWRLPDGLDIILMNDLSKVAAKT